MKNTHWRDVSAKMPAPLAAPHDLAPVHSRLDIAHDDIEKLAGMISETEAVALEKIHDVDIRVDLQVAAIKKEVDDRVKAVGEAMSEVMKKSLFDEQALRSEFNKSLEVNTLAILAKIPAIDAAYVKNKVAAIEGDLTILHNLEKSSVDAVEAASERMDGLEQVIANLQLPLPVKQNQWPAYIACLLALLGIALHFVP